MQGTGKGLGIADRYPRVSSATSASSSTPRKEERRSSKDENSFQTSRPSSQKVCEYVDVFFKSTCLSYLLDHIVSSFVTACII